MKIEWESGITLTMLSLRMLAKMFEALVCCLSWLQSARRLLAVERDFSRPWLRNLTITSSMKVSGTFAWAILVLPTYNTYRIVLIMTFFLLYNSFRFLVFSCEPRKSARSLVIYRRRWMWGRLRYLTNVVVDPFPCPVVTSMTTAPSSHQRFLVPAQINEIHFIKLFYFLLNLKVKSFSKYIFVIL